MLSLYRIQPNNTNKRSKKVSNTTLDNNSHYEQDPKSDQLSSKHLKMTSNAPIKKKTN